MAYNYGYFFPVEAGDDFYADQLNFLRESIDRRADQVGATVTLPASMSDDTPIVTTDTLFQDWLDAARTAVEAIITDGSYQYWDNSAKAFSPWTKAKLLGYVHATWSTACTPSDIADTEEWYTYSTAALNEYWIVYINEIYYALECLAYHEVATTEYATPTRTTKHGDGSDGSEGGDIISAGFVTVNSATQTGSFGAAVQPSSPVGVYFGDGAPGLWVEDNGSGGWTPIAESGCTLVGGSINYATGEWSVVADTVFAAGKDGAQYALTASEEGDPSVALGEAWTAFNAASFGAAGGDWEAIAHLHTYADGDLRIAYLDSYKLTSGKVTVPALTYDLGVLYLETTRTYFPYSPSPALAKGSGVGEVEVSTYRYHGWLKIEEVLNDEEVELAYHFDINETNFYGVEDLDAAAQFEVDPADGIGLCGFDGYCNGEYAPI